MDSVAVSGPLDFEAWEKATAPLRPLYAKLDAVVKDNGIVIRVYEYDNLHRRADVIYKERRRRVFVGTQQSWGAACENEEAAAKAYYDYGMQGSTSPPTNSKGATG